MPVVATLDGWLTEKDGRTMGTPVAKVPGTLGISGTGGQMSDGNIWDRVLARIEAKVNRHSFYTWFKPTAFVADDGTAIRVRVPNALFLSLIHI